MGERTKRGLGKDFPQAFGVTATLDIKDVKGSAIGAEPLWGAKPKA